MDDSVATPEQRLQETATIFVRAILRLRQQPVIEPPASSEVLLEFPANASLTVHRG